MASVDIAERLIADTGISMGDEGKGRLIPDLFKDLQAQTGTKSPVGMVVKINGGANSGHTAAGLKLNLLPAGVVMPEVPYLGIAAGVVADPRKALWEMLPLEKKGHALWDRLRFDERTMISDVSHRLLDLSWEYYRVNVLKEAPRGSTGRGISPSFLDEVAQFPAYYGDYLHDRSGLEKKLRQRIERTHDVLQHVCRVDAKSYAGFFDQLTAAEQRANAVSIESGVLPASEYDFTKFRGTKPWTLNADCVVEQYFDALERLSQNICDLRELALQVLSKNRFIIGEFGQSYWLDKRTGFSPNVTASHAYTPEFFQSLCIPTQPIRTIGSCKAYDTKVGTHIFLTQMEDGLPLTQKLKKLEFGATTGRQRMVGWWDSVEKADVLRYGGYQDIVINKLDVLSHDYEGDGDLKICVGYKACNGGILNEVPRSDSVRRQLEPIYETVPGWKEDISKIRSFADLPENAQNYVKQCMKSVIRLAQRGGHTIPLPNLRYIGVGPDPSQIIKDAPEVSELIS